MVKNITHSDISVRICVRICVFDTDIQKADATWRRTVLLRHPTGRSTGLVPLYRVGIRSYVIHSLAIDWIRRPTAADFQVRYMILLSLVVVMWNFDLRIISHSDIVCEKTGRVRSVEQFTMIGWNGRMMQRVPINLHATAGMASHSCDPNCYLHRAVSPEDDGTQFTLTGVLTLILNHTKTYYNLL